MPSLDLIKVFYYVCQILTSPDTLLCLSTILRSLFDDWER